MLINLKKLLPKKDSVTSNRFLKWMGPTLLHPQLWYFSRRGVALGVGLGIFFGFLIPLAQIPVAAVSATLLRANVPTAIARSVRNIVYTQFGEKFFNVPFGSDITNSLFENLDSISAGVIEDRIRVSIRDYEPRVNLIRVNVRPNFDNNEFNVTIVYEIIGIDISSQVQEIEFILQPTR